MAGGKKPVKGIPKRQRQGNDDLVRHGMRSHARPPETAIPPAYALSRRRYEISNIGEFMAVNEARIPRSFFCFGASAGGIEALIAILDRLPTDLDATVAIVVHRSPTAASALVDIFARHSRMPVVEPIDGDPIRRRMVYLAPQDRHLIMEGERWRIEEGTSVHRWRPAVDPLFLSVAKYLGKTAVGVLLSGGGADGVDGLTEIKKRGGVSIAQDPRQALQDSMPKSAIKHDDVDLVLRLEQIAAIIPSLAAGEIVGDGDSGGLLAGGTRH
jgi:two-component system chemotaxis response regulator CheB